MTTTPPKLSGVLTKVKPSGSLVSPRRTWTLEHPFPKYSVAGGGGGGGTISGAASEEERRLEVVVVFELDDD